MQMRGTSARCRKEIAMLRNMFKKTYTKIDTKYKPQAGSDQEPVIPEGLWRKCNKCGQPIYVEDVKNNYYVCPKCNGYFRVHAYRRIEMLADEGTFEEWNAQMEFSNPLGFPGYEEKVQAAQEKFHLNESIVKQYFRWMMGMFHGDFGQSYKFQQSVGSMITERIPVTLGLVGFSSIIGIAIAIPAGVLCAVKKNTWVDRIISIITIVLVSCPVFLVCILMILFLTQMPGVNFTGTYTNVHEYLERILLPSVALSFGMLALVSRVTRTSMIKELKSKYVETAEAKGISKKQIIFKHAFKNAIIPVITVMSIQIGAMVVGSVLVENVFALPGLGSLLINAINTSDYPIVQSVMLLLVAVFLILNLIVDIIYAIIDPRIRY